MFLENGRTEASTSPKCVNSRGDLSRKPLVSEWVHVWVVGERRRLKIKMDRKSSNPTLSNDLPQSNDKL